MAMKLERRLADERLGLQGRIYGYCPVQAYGTIYGKPFYFRARYMSWRFAVADAEGVDPVDIATPAQGFYREADYGEEDFDAGWMPHEEAEVLIRRCVRAYLSGERGR